MLELIGPCLSKPKIRVRYREWEGVPRSLHCCKILSAGNLDLGLVSIVVEEIYSDYGIVALLVFVTDFERC